MSPSKDSLGLRNPFPLEVRLLFLYNFTCWACGRSSTNLELHHIWGRISFSVLNAAPLCRTCHNAVKDTPEERCDFMRKTIEHVSPQGYKLTEYDLGFLESVKNDLSSLAGVLQLSGERRT